MFTSTSSAACRVRLVSKRSSLCDPLAPGWNHLLDGLLQNALNSLRWWHHWIEVIEQGAAGVDREYCRGSEERGQLFWYGSPFYPQHQRPTSPSADGARFTHAAKLFWPCLTRSNCTETSCAASGTHVTKHCCASSRRHWVTKNGRTVSAQSQCSPRVVRGGAQVARAMVVSVLQTSLWSAAAKLGYHIWLSTTQFPISRTEWSKPRLGHQLPSMSVRICWSTWLASTVWRSPRASEIGSHAMHLLATGQTAMSWRAGQSPQAVGQRASRSTPHDQQAVVEQAQKFELRLNT